MTGVSPTLEEVARLAGVSRATASRASAAFAASLCAGMMTLMGNVKCDFASAS